MRIVYLITQLDDVGGAQIHVRDLACALKSLGHDAQVLTGTEGPLADELANRSVPVHELKHLKRPIRPGHDVAAFFEVRRFLEELRPDIVSCHTPKAGILGRLAGWSAGMPVVTTAHGWGFTPGRPTVARVLNWLAERIMAPLCTRIITVCDSDRRAALKRRLAAPEKLVTVHNAVADVGPGDRADPTEEPPHIVMIARFVDEKDHATLLGAMAGLGDLPWHLEFVGEGPSLSSVRSLGASLDLEARVTYSGWRSDIPRRLANAQVFALISRWEGFPRSILEAMRAGLPVVASDVGGVGEAVVDGETGFVVPRGDVSTVRRRLRKLLESSSLRLEMGTRARERFERRFELQRLVQKTLAVYEEVLAVK